MASIETKRDRKENVKHLKSFDYRKKYKRSKYGNDTNMRKAGKIC